MSTQQPKRIPYGVSSYAKMVRKNCYFVDKTEYIDKLEMVENPIFLRPKRFGKSLFCSMLGHYYDLRYADSFDELFGHTWVTYDLIIKSPGHSHHYDDHHHQTFVHEV